MVKRGQPAATRGAPMCRETSARGGVSMTREQRRTFLIMSLVAGLIGTILYGLVGLSGIRTWGGIRAVLIALWGGYFFFSLLSGIMFTVRWVSARSLQGKILLTIFFPIPIVLAMSGQFYSVPYGIYNYIRYRNMLVSG